MKFKTKLNSAMHLIFGDLKSHIPVHCHTRQCVQSLNHKKYQHIIVCVLSAMNEGKKRLFQSSVQNVHNCFAKKSLT